MLKLHRRPHTSHQRAHRGYLLLEAMVSGAIAAAGLGGALVAIGSARAQVSHNARQATATALVSSVVEEFRARDIDTIATGTRHTARMPGLVGGYRLTTTVTEGTETIDSTALAFLDVVAEIECLDGACRAGSSTRLYR